MAFDPLNYRMRHPFPATLTGPVDSFYTTSQVIKKYTPGQYAFTWDPLYQYRIFKLVKNMSGATLAAGDLVSCVAAASVGTVTGGTTTSVVTSGMTANDMEWQMIVVADDAGAAGAAPEGEAALAVGNTTTTITLHPDYAFTAAVAASDSVYVVYINGVEDAAASDERGFGHGSIGCMGVAMSAAPDNNWFWICQRGWVRAKNTDALVAGQNIVAGTALIQDASDGAQELCIGECPVSQFAGTESSFATVHINCFDSITLSGTP